MVDRIRFELILQYSLIIATIYCSWLIIISWRGLPPLNLSGLFNSLHKKEFGLWILTTLRKQKGDYLNLIRQSPFMLFL